ncbi:hypothetical protein BH23PSE2_BH23PSE2_06050 [soil metagenome]
MYVCLCNGVTESDIRQAADAGCRSMTELTMRTGCGATCGSCVPLACALLAPAQDAAQLQAAECGGALTPPLIAHAA